MFTTGQIINSPSAYTDPRFYSGIDRQTGKGSQFLLTLILTFFIYVQLITNYYVHLTRYFLDIKIKKKNRKY